VQRLVPRRLGTVAAILVTLLVGLTAAGCRGDGAVDPNADPADDPSSSVPASESPSPDRMLLPKEPEPREGACHDLSSRQVSKAHDKRKPVRCRKSHTTQTYYVGAFTVDTFADQTPDTAAIAEYVTPKCTRHFKRWVGGDRVTRSLARVHPVWFVPTTRDIKRGARWFRCDVLVSATDKRLAELPRSTEGMLDSDSALDEYGLCSRGSPERPHSKTVICSRPHTWRAFDMMRMRGYKSDDYPSHKQRHRSAKHCQDQARVQLDYPLEWRYGWQPPTRQQWASGVRWGICWVPSD
jgi:hypothetical protein